MPSDRLIPGGEYVGRYQGQEYTVDTQGNITTLAGDAVDAPAELWSQVTAVKGGAGRFIVSPRRNHVLVRVREGEDWTTRFVTGLDRPLRPQKRQHRSIGYPRPDRCRRRGILD